MQVTTIDEARALVGEEEKPNRKDIRIRVVVGSDGSWRSFGSDDFDWYENAIKREVGNAHVVVVTACVPLPPPVPTVAGLVSKEKEVQQ